MTKNNQEFQDFLRDEVNPNPRRLARLNTSVGDVDRFLKNNLDRYQNMQPQGSYALDTLIKPVNDNDEYDADIQIVMNPHPNWQPKDYLDTIHKTLQQNQNYRDKLTLKFRCATISYAGDFHLDVVPRVSIRGKRSVCNRNANKFEETDGNGYRDWFNKQSQITDGNLKRVVRLLKYIRDRQNSYDIKSILLTTLAGNTIKSNDKGTNTVSSVADTLVTVLTRMDGCLQRHSRVPEIRNPALPSETFDRDWNQGRYEDFRNRVNSYAQVANRALREPSTTVSIMTWQQLFGPYFGK